MKSKIEKDKQIVLYMISLYCRHKEGNAALCTSCQKILEYATIRLQHCRYGVQKPTCKKCPIHCYRSDMRLAMQKVMRYAGPRMIIHHPWISIKHWLF